MLKWQWAVIAAGTVLAGLSVAAVTGHAPSPRPYSHEWVFSGTGDWDSPPFTPRCGAADAAYGYSANSSSIGPMNFIADLAGGSSYLPVANDVADNGAASTAVFPQPGGVYHLAVTAWGSWRVTVTESC